MLLFSTHSKNNRIPHSFDNEYQDIIIEEDLKIISIFGIPVT